MVNLESFFNIAQFPGSFPLNIPSVFQTFNLFALNKTGFLVILVEFGTFQINVLNDRSAVFELLGDSASV